MLINALARGVTMMNMWATEMLTQVQPTKGAEATVDPQIEALAMKRRELEIRELELKTKREELVIQKQQMENAERVQHIQQENAEKMQRIQIENAEKLQRMQLENAERIQKMQMENAERDRQLKYEEIKVRGQHEHDMLEAKQKQTEYQKERDDSLVNRNKRYGDVMKSVLSKMDPDPKNLPSYWQLVENLWEVYEVPEDIQAKLIIPQLTNRARNLIARLTVTQLSSYTYIRDFLNEQLRLTSREYRSLFVNASRSIKDESHVLYIARLKHIWESYCKSRKCDDFGKLCDLIVADKLKDTMSLPCLKHCLYTEGEKCMSASEIASLADSFDSNYFPDGRYRGNNGLSIE